MLPIVGSPTSVAVIGAGSWGTTVAAIISQHAPTTLWGRDPELVAEIGEHHTNSRYLDGITLPDDLRATDRARGRLHRRDGGGDGGAVPRLPRRARTRRAGDPSLTCRW